MAAQFLQGKLEGSSGAELDLWVAIENMYQRKHWHQLTQKLLELVAQGSFDARELYSGFVREFEDRLNRESLARLVLAGAAQAASPREAIEFVEGAKAKASTENMGRVIVDSALAHYNLLADNTAAAKELLAGCDKLLDEVNGVSPVHADYYKVLSEMHKINGDFAEFYAAALKFLGCIELQDLPVAEQVQRAFDLGLAALLGEGVYNFGELLAHPILDTLRGTDKEWLVEMLVAFNEGNIAKVNQLSSSWQSQADLSARGEFLHEKIRLLALMELVFQAPAQNRNLTFGEIAQKAELPVDMVELLVMRALSLGLVKGTINEVESMACLHWVQPRVLSIAQLAGMRDRLTEWVQKVDETAAMMKRKAPELLVQQ